MESFAAYLDIAIKAARAAGDLLRADFHRPTGPRGDGDKAPADTEAEQVIRAMLLGVEREWGFLGEETGCVPGAPGAPIWVVDPNDGTRDYIKGRRGSSVSIGLVHERRPVLGVVHPFGYPDDRGSIYAAAVGREGVWKDGSPVYSTLPDRLGELDVVLVSGGGDRAARANLECTRPARVMSIPSIAHRLAKVAAGEAAATTSLYSPKSWDFAAGHCLILAAGGALLDENGNEPAYDDDANGTAPRLFAGSRAVALELSTRNWDLAFGAEREVSMPIARLARGGAAKGPDLLSRAQGALLGHLSGSAFGSLFGGAEAPAPGLDSRTLEAAAARRRMPGQLGPSGEIAIAAARSLIELASDSRRLKRAYAAWLESSPDVPDRTMEAGLRGETLPGNLSPMSLARVTPLTLWGHEADSLVVAAKVGEDTALTHPVPAAAEASAVFAVVLHSLLQKMEARAAIDAAHAFARRSGFSREVIDAVAAPAAARTNGRPLDALGVLRVALAALVAEPSFEEAIESAIAVDRSSDALPSVVGALLGARRGRDEIPERLRSLVLSCRPMEGLAPRPRPAAYWATDAMTMAEVLLTAR